MPCGTYGGSSSSSSSRRQYRHSQNNGYAAAPRYRSQSPRDGQHHAASWLSDYISEPVYSDSDDYINSQDPPSSSGPIRPSSMSSPYSPEARGATNKHYYYDSSPRQPRWPTRPRYRTPSPSSDYIEQSVRTEDDYIATPAKLMPGAFVDDTPDYGNGHTAYGPDDSSPPQRSARKDYGRASSPSPRRASWKEYNDYRAPDHGDSDFRSSNWDRKHDSLRILSRSRSRNNGLKPHELENFQEAREFLQRFRALEVQGARRTAHSDAAYSSDEDRDDRSFGSHRDGFSEEWHDRKALARQRSYGSSSRHAEHDSTRPLRRITHQYHRDPSAERNTRYSPARRGRLDRFETRASYSYNNYSDHEQNAANDSDIASYRSASSARVSRAPSTTPSYVSRGPSPTPSYASRSRSRSHRAPRRHRTTRSRSSSDNGIAEGSDYLPSDDEDANADRGSLSGDEHRYHYSDDNGVGEGSDYLSSGDEGRERDGRGASRYSGVRLYARKSRENESYPVGIKRGWGSCR